MAVLPANDEGIHRDETCMSTVVYGSKPVVPDTHWDSVSDYTLTLEKTRARQGDV